MWGHKPKGCQDYIHNKDRRSPSTKSHHNCHITKTCECLYYGEMTKAGMVNGTSLGPNLLTQASALWEKNTKGIVDFLKDKYGEKFSAATTQHALDAVAVGLEQDAQKLRGPCAL